MSMDNLFDKPASTSKPVESHLPGGLLVAEGGGGSLGDTYAASHMGQQSIAVVGETRTNADGTKTNGFAILNGHVVQNHAREKAADYAADRETYDGGFAEEWLKGHYDSSNV